MMYDEGRVAKLSELIEEASIAQARGAPYRALLERAAAAQESIALQFPICLPIKRGVIAVGATLLWLSAGKVARAKSCAENFLSKNGGVSPRARAELHDLIRDEHIERALDAAEMLFDPASRPDIVELLTTLRHGETREINGVLVERGPRNPGGFRCVNAKPHAREEVDWTTTSVYDVVRAIVREELRRAWAQQETSQL